MNAEDQFFHDMDEMGLVDVSDKIRGELFEVAASYVRDTCEVSEYDISINSATKLNALNIIADGHIKIGRREFEFSLESGDNAGDVLNSWDGVGFKREQPEHVTYALVPTAYHLLKAQSNGHERQLLALWEAFEKRPDVAGITKSYAYDAYFSPGSERYWADKAKSLGFEITDKESADEERQNLKTAINQ